MDPPVRPPVPHLDLMVCRPSVRAPPRLDRAVVVVCYCLFVCLFVCLLLLLLLLLLLFVVCGVVACFSLLPLLLARDGIA